MADNLKISYNYLNPYEEYYNKFKTRSTYNKYTDEMFKKSANYGELDTIVYTLDELQRKTDAGEINFDDLAEEFNFELDNTDFAESVLLNELHGDREKIVHYEEEVWNAELAKNEIRSYDMSEYELNKMFFKRTAEYNAEIDRLRQAQEAKDNRSGGMKFLSALGDAFLTIPYEILDGMTSAIDGVLSIPVALVNSARNEGDFFENFEKSYIGNKGPLTELISELSGNAEWKNEVQEWFGSWSHLRDVQGNYTTAGQWFGGTANSIGQMIPSMLVGKGLGKLGVPAKAVSVTQQALYYGGMSSNTFREFVNDPRLAGVSAGKKLARAATQTAVEWAVQGMINKCFGPSMMDKVVFGYKGANKAIARVGTKSAIFRILGDAAHEGLEEMLQQYSNYFVDRLFAIGDENYEVTTEWDFSTAMTAFGMGALSSIAMSTFSVIGGRVKKRVKGAVDTGRIKKAIDADVFSKLDSLDSDIKLLTEQMDTLNNTPVETEGQIAAIKAEVAKLQTDYDAKQAEATQLRNKYKLDKVTEKAYRDGEIVSATPKMNMLAEWGFKATIQDVMQEGTKLLSDKRLSNFERGQILGQMMVTMENIASIYGNVGQEIATNAQSLIKSMQESAGIDLQSRDRTGFITRKLNKAVDEIFGEDFGTTKTQQMEQSHQAYAAMSSVIMEAISSMSGSYAQNATSNLTKESKEEVREQTEKLVKEKQVTTEEAVQKLEQALGSDSLMFQNDGPEQVSVEKTIAKRITKQSEKQSKQKSKTDTTKQITTLIQNFCQEYKLTLEQYDSLPKEIKGAVENINTDMGKLRSKMDAWLKVIKDTYIANRIDIITSPKINDVNTARAFDMYFGLYVDFVKRNSNATKADAINYMKEFIYVTDEVSREWSDIIWENIDSSPEKFHNFDTSLTNDGKPWRGVKDTVMLKDYVWEQAVGKGSNLLAVYDLDTIEKLLGRKIELDDLLSVPANIESEVLINRFGKDVLMKALTDEQGKTKGIHILEQQVKKKLINDKTKKLVNPDAMDAHQVVQDVKDIVIDEPVQALQTADSVDAIAKAVVDLALPKALMSNIRYRLAFDEIYRAGKDLLTRTDSAIDLTPEYVMSALLLDTDFVHNLVQISSNQVIEFLDGLHTILENASTDTAIDRQIRERLKNAERTIKSEIAKFAMEVSDLKPELLKMFDSNEAKRIQRYRIGSSLVYELKNSRDIEVSFDIRNRELKGITIGTVKSNGDIKNLTGLGNVIFNSLNSSSDVRVKKFIKSILDSGKSDFRGGQDIDGKYSYSDTSVLSQLGSILESVNPKHFVNKYNTGEYFQNNNTENIIANMFFEKNNITRHSFSNNDFVQSMLDNEQFIQQAKNIFGTLNYTDDVTSKREFVFNVFNELFKISNGNTYELFLSTDTNGKLNFRTVQVRYIGSNDRAYKTMFTNDGNMLSLMSMAMASQDIKTAKSKFVRNPAEFATDLNLDDSIATFIDISQRTNIAYDEVTGYDSYAEYKEIHFESHEVDFISSDISAQERATLTMSDILTNLDIDKDGNYTSRYLSKDIQKSIIDEYGELIPQTIISYLHEYFLRMTHGTTTIVLGKDGKIYTMDIHKLESLYTGLHGDTRDIKKVTVAKLEKLKNGDRAKLRDVLPSKFLSPALADVDVVIDDNLKAYGSYSNNVITINSKLCGPYVNFTLLHEYRHAVQDYFNLNGGFGTCNLFDVDFGTYILKNVKNIKTVTKMISDLKELLHIPTEAKAKEQWYTQMLGEKFMSKNKKGDSYNYNNLNNILLSNFIYYTSGEAEAFAYNISYNQLFAPYAALYPTIVDAKNGIIILPNGKKYELSFDTSVYEDVDFSKSSAKYERVYSNSIKHTQSDLSKFLYDHGYSLQDALYEYISGKDIYVRNEKVGDLSIARISEILTYAFGKNALKNESSFNEIINKYGIENIVQFIKYNDDDVVVSHLLKYAVTGDIGELKFSKSEKDKLKKYTSNILKRIFPNKSEYAFTTNFSNDADLYSIAIESNMSDVISDLQQGAVKISDLDLAFFNTLSGKLVIEGILKSDSAKQKDARKLQMQRASAKLSNALYDYDSNDSMLNYNFAIINGFGKIKVNSNYSSLSDLQQDTGASFDKSICIVNNSGNGSISYNILVNCKTINKAQYNSVISFINKVLNGNGVITLTSTDNDFSITLDKNATFTTQQALTQIGVFMEGINTSNIVMLEEVIDTSERLKEIKDDALIEDAKAKDKRRKPNRLGIRTTRKNDVYVSKDIARNTAAKYLVGRQVNKQVVDFAIRADLDKLNPELAEYIRTGKISLEGTYGIYKWIRKEGSLDPNDPTSQYTLDLLNKSIFKNKYIDSPEALLRLAYIGMAEYYALKQVMRVDGQQELFDAVISPEYFQKLVQRYSTDPEYREDFEKYVTDYNKDYKSSKGTDSVSVGTLKVRLLQRFDGTIDSGYDIAKKELSAAKLAFKHDSDFVTESYDKTVGKTSHGSEAGDLQISEVIADSGNYDNMDPARQLEFRETIAEYLIEFLVDEKFEDWVRLKQREGQVSKTLTNKQRSELQNTYEQHYIKTFSKWSKDKLVEQLATIAESGWLPKQFRGKTEQISDKNIKATIKSVKSGISVKAKQIASFLRLRSEHSKKAFLSRYGDLFNDDYSLKSDVYQGSWTESQLPRYVELNNKLSQISYEVRNGRFDHGEKGVKAYDAEVKTKEKALEKLTDKMDKLKVREVKYKKKIESLERTIQQLQIGGNNFTVTGPDSDAIPQVFRAVMETTWTRFAKTNVQLLADADEQHVVQSMNEFMKTNAEILAAMSYDEARDVAKFLANNLIVPTEAHSATEAASLTQRYQLYAVWFNTYLLALNDAESKASGNALIDADTVKGLENFIKSWETHMGRGFGSINDVIKTLKPFKTIVDAFAQQSKMEEFFADYDSDGEMLKNKDGSPKSTELEELSFAIRKNNQVELQVAINKLQRKGWERWAKINGRDGKSLDRFLDRFWKFQRMAMLSSPGTWGRNVISNTAVKGLNAASDAIGKLFTKVVDAKRGPIEGQWRMDAKPTSETDAWITREFFEKYDYVDYRGKDVKRSMYDILSDGLTKWTAASDKKFNLDEELAKLPKLTDQSKMDANELAAIRNAYTDILTNMIGESVRTDIFMKGQFGSSKAGKALNKVSQILFKFLSDDPWIRSATKKYFGRMLQESINDGKISTEELNAKPDTIEFMETKLQTLQLFSKAYTLGARDYMHRTNFITQLERQLSGKSKTAMFLYKQFLPFASAAWNWFTEGLNYTPMGLVKAVVDYARLEKRIAKAETKLAQGKYTGPDVSFIQYLTKRNIGKGVIGTVGFGIGLLLAGFGILAIDDEDDKIKISIGNIKVDISDIFGTSSLLAGAAMVSVFRNEGNFWGALSAMNNQFLEDSIFTDLHMMFSYDSVGDAIVPFIQNKISTIVPNIIKNINKLLYVHTPQYSSGMMGQFERWGSQIVPGLVYALPRRFDPYTGEYQLKYANGNTANWFQKFAQVLGVKIYEYNFSDIEAEAAAQGVRRGELTCRYEDIGNFDSDAKAKANEYYGSKNKKDLEELYSNETKYKVLDKKTNKYVEVTYSKMTTEQKKAVIERIMTNNSKLAKIYTYTQILGGKYYASVDEYKELTKLGIKKNVYKENSKQKGFIS